MEKVLLESPISPITVSREKAAEFGVRLKYTSGFVKEALDYAEKSELGVRSLNTVVDETASKAIIQCLKLGNEQIMIRHLDLSSEAAGKAAYEQGIRQVDVDVKGPGPGREGAIRSLAVVGLQVLSIVDSTPIPHNGCRPPKRPRG